VVRYENRKTGRTVTLVMVSHIGTSAYFTKLDDILAGLEAEGAVICYERVGPAADEQWAAASDEERAARGHVWSVSDQVLSAACRHLGWVDQGRLKYSPSWRNVDMTDLEFVRRAQPQKISEQHDGISDLFAGLTPEQFEVVAGSFEALAVRLLALVGFRFMRRRFTPQGGPDKHVSRVMVEERNREALAGLPSDADAVLLWGSSHLTGLAAGLKKAGYRRRSTTWVPVGKLPAIWPCLKAVWMWALASDEDDSSTPVPDDVSPSGAP
jgi:hypothetical protein